MKSQDLPEGCVAHILSYICTPEDIVRLSLVSKAFYSAADYDTVWDRFIPSDFSSTISPLSSSNSKKDLYFTLSDRPTIIDQGRKVRTLFLLACSDVFYGIPEMKCVVYVASLKFLQSFQLEKRTAKKCYMLSARDISITWAPTQGEASQYWEWKSLPESRFQEVARLYAVCWFNITGQIKTRVLSPNTQYAAFLVFQMIDASGFHHHPAMLSVSNVGGSRTSKYVCLDPNLEDNDLDDRFRGLQRPNVRKDKWLEIEMGEFFNSGLEEDEIYMNVRETSDMWKHGFILEGIEVRPKHV
ncbi:hypothetical protein JHK82_028408 [Glycine max]|uniref:F-box domain-containing protein n=2 Tax=Glycine subgen. Soja TaxID=1462606 RepID=I1LBU4_SOYBN|nr:hypothetical protein JHK85_029079 [Glycine max]KAG5004393.1 hypothetical protein JHK86_028532 [Glycine max]KAG5127573.1 hypothetical protein JHK82_028408 [Glycine max]